MNDYEPPTRPRRPNPRPGGRPAPGRRPPARSRRKQTAWLPAVSLLLFLVVLAGGGFLVLRHLQNNADYIPVGTPPILADANNPAAGTGEGLPNTAEISYDANNANNAADTNNTTNANSANNANNEAPSTDVSTDTGTQPVEAAQYAQGVALAPAPLSSIADTRYLELVNRQHEKNGPLNYDYIVSAWPTVPVRATDITLHQTALNAVEAMFADGRHIAEFFVTSGYRDVARQAQIYNNATDRSYVMPPGHSEHNLGIGIDILAPGIPMNSAQMSGTPESNWLAENAWRFGMVLRYPAHAIHITEVSYEPWHFRYVGLIHAWYMTENNLVLEEYLEHLAATGGFTATLNGVTYHVIYGQPAGDMLYVPINLPFEVSASNRGGYVITARAN
ncbi:MAG: M15 family metallopeptidase [Defluviitaleaceae bacterium]|nr:M15 family metallopeptidase [Defluviitaleaceae bacterium]